MQRRGQDLVVDPASGYELVGDVDGQPDSYEPLIWAHPGAVMRYGLRGSADRELTLAVVADAPGRLDVYRWAGAGETRATRVRGHDGWVVDASHGPAPATGLAWREGPGVLVSAFGRGISEGEVRAAVESLRPASDEEWDRLVAIGKANAEDDLPTLAQGDGWRYARDGDEGVCFEVPVGGVASGTCGGELDEPQAYEGAEQVDDGWWLHGRVTENVNTVSVEVDGTEPEVVDTIPMTGTELRAWAVHVPLGSGRATIVTRDGSGAELERLPVDVPARIEPPQSTTTVP
jgi:hypothetical protein